MSGARVVCRLHSARSFHQTDRIIFGKLPAFQRPTLSVPVYNHMSFRLLANFHPETETFIKFLSQQTIADGSQDNTPELARKSLHDGLTICNGQAEFAGQITDLCIPSTRDQNGIPVTVYIPSPLPDDAAILVYFHGGGMVIGTRASVDTTCRRLSMDIPCIIVNVEYRLAPEHKFPASSEDTETVTSWVVANRIAVGGSERSPVGVGGDSAGGTLAANVAHEVSGLAFQLLVYPRVNYRDGPERESAEEYKDGPIISREVIKWYRRHFLRNDGDRDDIRLNAYFREKFDHLPPALMVVAECDPLRDDSYDYQVKLRDAGVKAEVLQIDGASHAFFTKPGIFKECCAQAYKRVADFIREVAYSRS